MMTQRCLQNAAGRAAARHRRRLFLTTLLMLEGFMLGGLVTTWLMRNLVLRMMSQYWDQTQSIAVYNLLDHLVPYYLFFGGGFLALALALAALWMWISIKPLLLRLIKGVLTLGVMGMVALVVSNWVVAYTTREAPLQPAARSIAEQARAEYVRQVPLAWTIIRVVVTSVEECNGDYFVRLDDYRWWGRGQGFVKYSKAGGVVGGGTGAGAEALSHWRGGCRQQ